MQAHISNIYQQYIINKSSPQGTQRTQDVCTIFLFIMDNNPRIFRKQLNRVQLYKSTNSICKNQLTFLAPTEMRQQSSIDINLSTGTRPVSSVACVCTCPGSLQPACECGQCIMQQTYASKKLVFCFLHMLKSSTTCNHFLFYLPLSKLTHSQSQYIQAL